ncbi:MAG: helix-turn-helix domain-containing protein [Streptomyces sp.]|jgi:DNA-binding transcriptional ArsR family regulator|nr:helix-turn-helix domain-containing protein [Streptomyces sp.]
MQQPEDINPGAEEVTSRVLDARSLRGIAHPLRMQLLNTLRRGGPATASQLAAKLGESSGATSYHLRQLAAHGFVVDAPEHGKGRERWWKAADEALVFDSDKFADAGSEMRGTVDLFLHEVANTHAREMSTWIGTRDEWPEPWSHATDMSDATLRLTPELARELVAKMHALVQDYRTLSSGEDTPETEQVRVHTHLFPVQTD